MTEKTYLDDIKSFSNMDLVLLHDAICELLEDRDKQRKRELAGNFADAVLAIKKEFPYMKATYGICDEEGTEIDFIRDLPDTKNEIIGMFHLYGEE